MYIDTYISYMYMYIYMYMYMYMYIYICICICITRSSICYSPIFCRSALRTSVNVLLQVCHLSVYMSSPPNRFHSCAFWIHDTTDGGVAYCVEV